MMDLSTYFRDVESAPKLAARVGCHHSTLYRIADGRIGVTVERARQISAATRGQVSAASILRLVAADHQLREVGAAEAGQESGEVGDGVDHDPDATDAPARRQREALP